MKTSYEMFQNLEEVRKLILLKSMSFVYTLEEVSLSLKEVISSLDAESWQEAINDEMDFYSLTKHDTYLTCLIVAKSIGCIWIWEKETKT